MKDRQPLHAGRVRLLPVAGQSNTFDLTMADGATETGTPLNKATLLKDATAAAFGLDRTAVPDDVLAKAAVMLSNRPRMQYGSYVGDGASTKTFTFEFDVDVLIIAKADAPATGAYGSTTIGTVIVMRGETGPHLTYNNLNERGGFTADFNGHTIRLSPYSRGAAGDVMNTSGTEYIYCSFAHTELGDEDEPISVTWDAIVNKPTTIAGYGITDAASKAALESTDKLLYNVTELLKGHEYSLQDGTTPAYTQSVPAGAQRYALLAMLGGHSEVVNGEVIHGKCDKIVTDNGELVIPAQVQALDGYGWSAGDLYNYVDFSAQQFHKRIGRIELGSLNWRISSSNPSRFYASVPSGNLWKYQAGNVMLCDVYTFDGEGNTVRGYYGADGTIRYYRSGGSPLYELYVVDGGTYANIAEFKAHLAGKYIYFEAANEIVTDIATDDIYIDTEQDGTVTFHQLDDAEMLLPNKVTYMVRNEEAI